MDRKKRSESIVNDFNKLITEKERIINKDLFKKHFNFESLKQKTHIKSKKW